MSSGSLSGPFLAVRPTGLPYPLYEGPKLTDVCGHHGRGTRGERMSAPQPHFLPEPLSTIELATDTAERLLDNVATVVRGKRHEIRLVLTALACRGHVLFEDAPGTA